MSLPFAGIVVVWSGERPRHDAYRIGDRFVLGADIVDPSDDRISRQHTAFSVEGGRLRIADCDSRNGTFVERQRIDAQGLAPALPAIVRSGRTLSVALADVRAYEGVKVARRGGLVIAGCLAKQVRAIDAAAIAEENVMIFGTSSVGRELAMLYAQRLGGTCAAIETSKASLAAFLERDSPLRTIIVIVDGRLGNRDWRALAPWLETDVRFVFVMRHDAQALGMPTELATKLAGTIVAIPRLRFDELPTVLDDIARARGPRLHVSAVEGSLLRARTTDEDEVLDAFRAALARWGGTGAYREDSRS